MGTKYGKTDPSVFQLRDMQRRLTRVEKAIDRVIQKAKRTKEEFDRKIARTELTDDEAFVAEQRAKNLKK